MQQAGRNNGRGCKAAAGRAFLYTRIVPLACAARTCAPPERGTHATALQRLPSCAPLSLRVAAMIGLLLPAGCCSCARSDSKWTAAGALGRKSVV